MRRELAAALAFLVAALGVVGYSPRAAFAADGDTGTTAPWSWVDGSNGGGYDLAFLDGGDSSTYVDLTATYPATSSPRYLIFDVACVVSGVAVYDTAQTGYFSPLGYRSGGTHTVSIGNTDCGTDTIRVEFGYTDQDHSPSPGDGAGPMASVQTTLYFRKDSAPEVPLPACTTSQVRDPAVRYDPSTGLVSQRFKVGMAGYAGTTTVVTTTTGGPLTDSIVPPGDAVDGAPGYYYHSHAYTGSLTAESAVSTFDDGTGPVCTVTTTPVTAGSVHPDGSTVGASDPTSGSGGADCGLNPFCYIKAALAWAFVPTTSPVDAWTSAESGWSSHFPVNVMVSGAAGVTAFMTMITCGSTCDDIGTGPTGGTSFVISGGSHSTTVGLSIFDNDFTHGGSALPWIGVVRGALIFFFGLGLAWALWNRVSRSFGSKAPATGGGA